MHQTTILWEVLGFGFIFSLALLLSIFFKCTYFNHPILIIKISIRTFGARKVCLHVL